MVFVITAVCELWLLTEDEFRRRKEAFVTSRCCKGHINSSCLVLKELERLRAGRNGSREAGMQTTSKSENAREAQPHPLNCVICGKPTVRLVDGEPSCDYHANQVYEHQMEEYVRKHLN